jgi:hypothetical protein
VPGFTEEHVMKKFVLCCALLGSTLAVAALPDGGPGIDAGTEPTSVVLSTGSTIALAKDKAVVVVNDADPAATTPSLDAPLMSAKGFFLAVKTGNGWLAAMFMLFFFVGGMRIGGKWLHNMIPDETKNWFLAPVERVLYFFFDMKLGGWILNWLSAIGGCLSTAAMAGMPVDAASWKVALLASTGGTVLIELKDDVMEWWALRKKKAAEKAAAEAAAKLAVVGAPPVIIPDPPKP